MPEGVGSHDPLDAVAHIALRVGRGLLADDADVAYTRSAVEQVVADFGFRAHVLVEPEAVLVTVQGAQDLRTKIGRALPAMAVDMGRLVRLGTVMDDIANGNRSIIIMHTQLDAVNRATSDSQWG